MADAIGHEPRLAYLHLARRGLPLYKSVAVKPTPPLRQSLSDPHPRHDSDPFARPPVCLERQPTYRAVLLLATSMPCGSPPIFAVADCGVWQNMVLWGNSAPRYSDKETRPKSWRCTHVSGHVRESISDGCRDVASQSRSDPILADDDCVSCARAGPGRPGETKAVGRCSYANRVQLSR